MARRIQAQEGLNAGVDVAQGGVAGGGREGEVERHIVLDELRGGGRRSHVLQELAELSTSSSVRRSAAIPARMISISCRASTRSMVRGSPRRSPIR